jgi:mRNA interferase MazF
MLARDCQRGEIVLVNLDPSVGREQAKTRPCLVLQTDLMRVAPMKVIAPITDIENIKGNILPFMVRVSKGDGGLKKDSVILLHQIRVVDESRFVEVWGKVKPATLDQAVDALKFVIDIR